MRRKALITGITGQDGSYLAEFLLNKGYEVHGIIRRSSSFNTGRIDHIYQGPFAPEKDLFLHYGDLTDEGSLGRLIYKIAPDEIYNLAAQSHVGVSFEIPTYTSDVVAMGTLRILEAVRSAGLIESTRFYQASSSELFGKVQAVPQTENTPFYPRSPYAVAKQFAYWITVNYREAYGLFGCNGILFNHESPRRGGTFVTQKIVSDLTRCILGGGQPVFLGNLNSLRDWGHARDYVEMQWLMLQQDEPNDFVIATGRETTVRDFVLMVAKELEIEIEFRGEGMDEYAIITNEPPPHVKVKKGDVVVGVKERYFRPSEVDRLLGDASLARQKLNWVPKTTVEDLCQEMVAVEVSKYK